MEDPPGINLDTYYRGLAAERLQHFADQLMALSGEAGSADAHQAALDLADLATQLLDMGVALYGRRLPPERGA